MRSPFFLTLVALACFGLGSPDLASAGNIVIDFDDITGPLAPIPEKRS